MNTRLNIPERDKKPAIVIDLDGTLANVDHRRHYAETKQWPKFDETMDQDGLNVWCKEIIEKFRPNYKIILLTGRMMKPENYEKTMKWLQDHKIHFDEFHARPNGDFTKDCDLKEDIYKRKVEPNYDVLFCVDDRVQVIEMWRRLGLVCLACDHGDF